MRDDDDDDERATVSGLDRTTASRAHQPRPTSHDGDDEPQRRRRATDSGPGLLTTSWKNNEERLSQAVQGIYKSKKQLPKPYLLCIIYLFSSK